MTTKPTAKRRRVSRAVLWSILGGSSPFLAFLAFYAFGLYRMAQHPTLTRNALQEMTAHLEGVGVDQRGWPLIAPFAERGELSPPADSALGKAWPSRPGDALWSEAVEFVLSRQDAIEAIHAAADRPYMGAEPDNPMGEENPFQLTLLYPYLASTRACAWLLRADSDVAILNADAARLERDIRSMIRLGTSLHRYEETLHTLVGVAVHSLADSVVSESLNAHPELYDGARLGRLAALLEEARPPSFEQLFISERRAAHDVLQRVFTDDGDGDGYICGRGLSFLLAIGGREPSGLTVIQLPLTRFRYPSRREMHQMSESILQEAEGWVALPRWKRADPTFEALAAFHGMSKRNALCPAIISAPSLSLAITSLEQRALSRDGVRCGIAIERFRRRYGRLPDSLAELVPEFLTEVPIDPMDGAPLRYRVINSRPLVYSVGNDRDDDQGRITSDQGAFWRALRWASDTMPDDEVDTDFVVWPIPTEFAAAENGAAAEAPDR